MGEARSAEVLTANDGLPCKSRRQLPRAPERRAGKIFWTTKRGPHGRPAADARGFSGSYRPPSSVQAHQGGEDRFLLCSVSPCGLSSPAASALSRMDRGMASRLNQNGHFLGTRGAWPGPGPGASRQPGSPGLPGRRGRVERHSRSSRQRGLALPMVWPLASPAVGLPPCHRPRERPTRVPQSGTSPRQRLARGYETGRTNISHTGYA